jgi:hypothetical protein
MGKKPAPTSRREIRCYFCGHQFEVSTKTLSVPCPHCNKALKVEDVVVNSYLPVNDLQTCGKITISSKGRVVAKVIRSGDGIECEGTLEGAIETDGDMLLGPKATWKGQTLQSKSLHIADGAKLIGIIKVPWQRASPEKKTKSRSVKSQVDESVESSQAQEIDTP